MDPCEQTSQPPVTPPGSTPVERAAQDIYACLDEINRTLEGIRQQLQQIQTNMTAETSRYGDTYDG